MIYIGCSPLYFIMNGKPFCREKDNVAIGKDCTMDIPQLTFERIDKHDMCFGCGSANLEGLHMKFLKKDGMAAEGEYTPAESHQGWPGYVHGGILMTALDETIGWVCHLNQLYTVTAKIEVRLKSMARIGEPLVLNAEIVKKTSRTLEVEARMERRDGSVVAEASSLQFIARPS